MRTDETSSRPNRSAESSKAMGIPIVVIGDAHDDSATEWAKFQFADHILVKNLVDMVNKVINRCTRLQTRMNCLVIVGHGSPGQQQIGYAGKGGDILDIASIIGAHYEQSHKRRKLVFKYHPDGKLRATMARLGPFFTPDAQVILGGCNVGEEPEVARALARLLHVPVSAYCNQQKIPLPHLWLGREVSFNASGGLQKGAFSDFPIHSR